MSRSTRSWRVWVMVLAGAAALAAILLSVVLVGADRGTSLTATPYSDVIRFEAAGAASLEVRVFDLSGKELWSSGIVSDSVLDWDRTNTWGERLAYGSYLYSAQAWDGQGGLLFDRTGKLALLPGDKVQLQAAPALSTSPTAAFSFGDDELSYQPMGLGDTGVFNKVGIGTDAPTARLHVYASWPEIKLQDPGTGTPQVSFYSGGSLGGFFQYSQSINSFRFGNYKAGGDVRLLSGGNNERMTISAAGSVGIGTTSPTKKLDVVGDAAVSGTLGVGTTNATARLTVQGTSGDLIAAYNGPNRVFVVKNSGEVRADGAFYGASFNAEGSADIAERINTSEWVEAGDVVEIDADHPGFFCKSVSTYSRKVAGIVSTSPGVILGNAHEEQTDQWNDARPLLAIAGRVPVKVTTENGPIQVGDLLVSSSTPGFAMRGTDSSGCIGAVVAKAMEPLKDGSGVIMAQVSLR